MECAFSLKTAQLKARPWDIEPRFSTDTPGYSSYGMSMPVVCYRAMRRSFVFGLLLFVAAASAILCRETKRNFPRPTGYIDDFANVVDAGTKERLTALCTELDQKTNGRLQLSPYKRSEGLQSKTMPCGFSMNGELGTKKIIEAS